jgi:hypothetical protein
VVKSWIPKATQIGQLEIFAAPIALDTWKGLFANTRAIFFVDNNSALSSLTKGYSPRLDSVQIVGDFWLRACKLQMQCWFERVESESNLSDGPSRFDFDLIKTLGGQYCKPGTDLLSQTPLRDPSHWFATVPSD